jgi:protein OS-9
VSLLLKVIQEFVLGEFDDDATAAYHENSTSELADDDHHVKDISKRCCTELY